MSRDSISKTPELPREPKPRTYKRYSADASSGLDVKFTHSIFENADYQYVNTERKNRGGVGRRGSVDDSFMDSRKSQTQAETEPSPVESRSFRRRINSTSTLFVKDTMSVPNTVAVLDAMGKKLARYMTSGVDQIPYPRSRLYSHSSISSTPSLSNILTDGSPLPSPPIQLPMRRSISASSGKQHRGSLSISSGRIPFRRSISSGSQRRSISGSQRRSISGFSLRRGSMISVLSEASLVCPFTPFDEPQYALKRTMSAPYLPPDSSDEEPDSDDGKGDPKHPHSQTRIFDPSAIPATSALHSSGSMPNYPPPPPPPPMPNEETVTQFVKMIFKECQLEVDTIIICLIYIERLLHHNVKFTPRNFRPIVLTAFLLASKVWDDLSMWNVDFSSILPDFSLPLLNKWECIFLSSIGFNVTVSASDYAKRHFLLREMGNGDSNEPVEDESTTPLDLRKARKLEAISVSKDFDYKERHRRRTMSIAALDLKGFSRAVLN